MTDENEITPEQAVAAFSSAALVEPNLFEVLHLAGAQDNGDLPSVERWLGAFNQLVADKPRLASRRKLIFAHLLRVHNAAVERAAAHNRTEAAK